jgi:hypothetical protein
MTRPLLELAIPVFRVGSAAAAERFYCDRLGFRRLFASRPDPAGADPCYLGLARDAVRLHLSSFPGDGVAGPAGDLTRHSRPIARTRPASTNAKEPARMNDRTTKCLLTVVAALLAVHLFFRASPAAPAAPAAESDAQAPAVIRAQEFLLVDKQGKAVAQLHAGEDGGGNLRLRSGDGTIRVKLGATADGAALLLLDRAADPAIRLATDKSGTTATLAEKGKEKKVIRP